MREAGLAAVVLLSAAIDPPGAAAAEIGRLADLPLNDLADIEVTSVSKSAELLRAAPSAIYVITHDEIQRSGATSIAEALRLAPNLQIAQYTSSNYIVGARGFGGAQEAQNFSNKMLILIDGRSVYSPLYSGVYLDTQDLLMEDIDRIEVISGPGATLWGANAMNGVINVITRPAYLTQENLVNTAAGTHARIVSGRFAKRPTADLAYRIYGKAFERDAMELADGSDAGDDWRKVQGGFRVDWTGAEDSITVQGDIYGATLEQRARHDVEADGHNVLGRWQHRTTHSEWQLQAYYDRTTRDQPVDGAGFDLDTFDLEIQQRIDLGTSHRIVWGAGGRWHDYDIRGSEALKFEPSRRSLSLANVFAQDTFALTSALDLTIGLKLENGPFDDWEALPDLRLAWRPSEEHLVWAAASRAIRAATPFDVDVREIDLASGMLFVVGNPDFEPEQVDAYQLGYRGLISPDVSISVSTFYNVHDNLRTIEPDPATLIPLTWDNLMEGTTYGLEVWAKWQVNERWRLAPGVRLLRKRLEFKPGASRLLGLSQAGNDPRSQGLLTSSIDLSSDVTFDATLRYVDDLPDPALPSYTELNASLHWRATEHIELSITGLNLLDSRHQEYPGQDGHWIRRSILAKARWQF